MSAPDNILNAFVSKGSFYVIRQRRHGVTVGIARKGRDTEVILAATPGEANRARMPLSDAGLVGYAADAI